MIGTVVGGKYRVVSALGAGGMGAVFIAVQEPLGRRVALKIIKQAQEAEDARDRFLREAKIVGQLRCPHVVTLYDFGEHEGLPFIVMELLEGETLRSRLNRGPLSLVEALSLARDLACGLKSAHLMGVVHRDLKPDNVVLLPDKERGFFSKLLDFGIAKLTADDAAKTGAGIVIGTAGYVAPEVAFSCASDDPRTDFYALGVILYEALAGAPPYTGATAAALLLAHATTDIPDVRARNPDVPAAVAAFVSKLLAKTPGERPADADALIVEIDALRASVRSTDTMPRAVDVVTSAPVSTPEKPSVAVQPFHALGGTDEDALLAEGISEDILTALSCFKQLFVIAQTTMWQPGGRDTDALRVGRKLGVRYVLQGNIRRSGDQLRVSTKLVDAISGATVWGSRYDRPMGDLFAMQDELTQAIVACVAGRVEADVAEQAKRKAPHTLAAYDWLARGRAYHHRRTPQDNILSREALDKAIELDPEYAQAHAWRACAYGQAKTMGFGDDKWQECVAAVDRALRIDDGDAECQRLAAELAFAEANLAKAEHHHQRAIALNPNDARIVGQGGELAVYLGKLDVAVDALLHAIRLDPLGPKPYMRHLARARYLRRELDEAKRLLAGLDHGRADVVALSAAVAATAGDVEAAQTFVDKLRAISPHYSAEKECPPFVTTELKENWLKGFRAAGL